MKIQAKDLSFHLKGNLHNFYFVFGEEPLQHKETLDKLRSTAKRAGYVDRQVFEITSSSNWELLTENFCTPDLFLRKRLIECHIPEGKISNKATENLTKLVDIADKQEIIFLLIAHKIDAKTQQSTWFTTLERKGCTIAIRELSKEETFLWLEKKLKANGLSATSEVVSLLFERTEGSLLALSQVIEKIRLYGCQQPSELKLEDILQIVGEGSRKNVFDLIDAALLGSPTRTLQIFSSLKNEGVDPTLLVWALAREIRTVILLISKVKGGPIPPHILQELGIWKRREPLIKALRDRFSVSKLQEILIKIKGVDDILKGRIKGDAWCCLSAIYLTITGHYYG